MKSTSGTSSWSSGFLFPATNKGLIQENVTSWKIEAFPYGHSLFTCFVSLFSFSNGSVMPLGLATVMPVFPLIARNNKQVDDRTLIKSMYSRNPGWIWFKTRKLTSRVIREAVNKKVHSHQTLRIHGKLTCLCFGTTYNAINVMTHETICMISEDRIGIPYLQCALLLVLKVIGIIICVASKSMEHARLSLYERPILMLDGFSSWVLVFGSWVRSCGSMSLFKRPINKTARNPSWRIMLEVSHKHGEPGCSHGSQNSDSFKPVCYATKNHLIFRQTFEILTFNLVWISWCYNKC